MRTELSLLAKVLESFKFAKESSQIKKIAEGETSTAPLYEDESGKEFTAGKIVLDGEKPSGKLKPKSLKDRIYSESFGKVKK